MKRLLSTRCLAALSLALALLALAPSARAFYLDVPQAPAIPNRTFRLADFGGVGDGKTLNTEAFKKAIDACEKAGGGVVVVPAGTFVTGPIHLASRMALQLDKGAVVRASGKLSDFGLPDPLPDTQAGMNALHDVQPLIQGAKLTDIAIRGEGTIDGGGGPWWALTEKAPVWASPPPGVARGLTLKRPNMIVLHDCERVHVQGVTLQNAPQFHFVPSRCREILVEDVKILAPPDSPNTDGIDPGNASDVLIRRCFIDTGDDCIAIKSGGTAPASENITVTGCTFKHGHGVSIGSETQAGVRNMLVEKCTFEGTDNGLRIKSDRKRGGTVENVTYRDIVMKDVGLPITLFLFYDDKKEALAPRLVPATATTPALRNIRFENISCDGATKKAGEIVGLPESPITGVCLQNVRLTRVKDAFAVRDATGVEFRNVEVLTAAGAGSAPSPTPAAGEK